MINRIKNLGSQFYAMNSLLALKVRMFSDYVHEEEKNFDGFEEHNNCQDGQDLANWFTVLPLNRMGGA
jgi:hypothetical protein